MDSPKEEIVIFIKTPLDNFTKIEDMKKFHQGFLKAVNSLLQTESSQTRKLAQTALLKKNLVALYFQIKAQLTTTSYQNFHQRIINDISKLDFAKDIYQKYIYLDLVGMLFDISNQNKTYQQEYNRLSYNPFLYRIVSQLPEYASKVGIPLTITNKITLGIAILIGILSLIQYYMTVKYASIKRTQIISKVYVRFVIVVGIFSVLFRRLNLGQLVWIIVTLGLAVTSCTDNSIPLQIISIGNIVLMMFLLEFRYNIIRKIKNELSDV